MKRGMWTGDVYAPIEVRYGDAGTFANYPALASAAVRARRGVARVAPPARGVCDADDLLGGVAAPRAPRAAPGATAADGDVATARKPR